MLEENINSIGNVLSIFCWLVKYREKSNLKNNRITRILKIKNNFVLIYFRNKKLSEENKYLSNNFNILKKILKYGEESYRQIVFMKIVGLARNNSYNLNILIKSF